MDGARKWVRGTGQAGRTSSAEWTQQGRSRGSICVCCTIPSVRPPLLAPMRPPGSLSGSRPTGLYSDTSAARHPLPHLLHRPPSAAVVRCVRSSHQQRAPRAAARVAMGRLPGNKSRAEARSLGDNVVSGPRARRRSQERSSLSPVSLSHLCSSLLPHCCANAWAVAHSTLLLAFPCSLLTRLRRGPPYAPASRATRQHALYSTSCPVSQPW